MTQAKPPTPVPESLLAAEQLAAAVAAEPPELQRWMCFSLAGADYAVNVLQLREVLPEAQPEPVPGAPAAVLGVLNLRGEILTLLDLGAWLGLAPAAVSAPVLVLEHQGQYLALRVDALGQLIRLMPDQLLAAEPAALPALQPLLCGASRCDAVLLPLLDFAPLLAPTAQAP